MGASTKEKETWPTKEFKKGIISKSTLRPGALDVPKNNPRHPEQVNIPIPVVPTSHSNSGTLWHRKTPKNSSMLGEVAPTWRQELLFWLLRKKVVIYCQGFQRTWHNNFTTEGQTKYREKRYGKALSAYFSHSQQMNHPKLTPCSAHRSIFPTGSSTCWYFMCTEFSFASWLENLNFPSLGLDLLATSDPGTMKLLKYSNQVMLLWMRLTLEGFSTKTFPICSCWGEKDSTWSQW